MGCLTNKSLLDQASDFVACQNQALEEKDLLALAVALLQKQANLPVVSEPYDEIDITYIGATNNINTVVYSLDGATVATLTFTYASAGAADDDLVTKVVKS